ncbi:hypothetical protein QQF64_001320 [Cirrhinus molitorella]|uniref:Uncharacterized protein n=1 Tax=Cirrhinus molitorella TaxID=172907 RepID=A0ABR3P074_9TELE
MDWFLVTPTISLPQFLSAAGTGNGFWAHFSSCAVPLALIQYTVVVCLSVGTSSECDKHLYLQRYRIDFLSASMVIYAAGADWPKP